MRQRTKKLAVDVISFLCGLYPHKAMRVIEYHLTKAVTSVAAN